jgi:hypothetical protein
MASAGTTTAGRPVSAFGPISPQESRRLGRLGGALFLSGAAFSFPAGFMLDPVPPAEAHLLGISGVVLGVVAMFLRWDKISPRWLHVLLIAGVIEVALAVAVFSDDFAFYYVTVAAFAAYAVRDRRVLAAYLGMLTLALLAPLVYDHENFRAQAHHILVTLPVLMIIGALVLYLRVVLERREQSYRAFALEAVSLAIRIRGRRRRTAGKDADELELMLDEIAAEAQRELSPPTAQRILDHIEEGRTAARD